MLFISYLFFFAFLVYLFLGIYAYNLNPKARVNQLFLILCFVFCIWSLDNMLFNILQDKNQIWFFYRLFSFGWCFFPAVTLHFCLVLTRREWLLKQWWLYPLLYFPGTFFAYKTITGTLLVLDFIRGDFGWKAIYALDSPLYGLYNMTYPLYLAASLVFISIWGSRVTTRREKMQARVFAFSGLLSFMIGMIIETLLPIMNIRLLPPIAPFTTLIWVLGMWFSIVKYKMMTLSPEIATNEIISKMMDLLILINPGGYIMKVNPHLEKTLGFYERELINKHITKTIMEEGIFTEEFNKMIKNPAYKSKYETQFKTKTNDFIPVDVYSALLKDLAGEVIGAIIVGHDLIQMKQLQKEIQERINAEEKLKNALEKLKIRNDAMQTDLNMAKKIQYHFIPMTSPSPNISFSYKPTDSVGGDFYDFIHFKDSGKIGIFLSDVSGHGVPAAFITSMIKSFILQAGEIKNNPAEFLLNMNNLMIGQTGGNFITAIYGIYDQDKNIFQFSCAGHNSPYIITDQSVELIKNIKKSIPIAVMSNEEIGLANKTFQNEEIHLQKGNKLVLYTDGLVEAVNIRNPNLFFEDQRMKEVFFEFKDMNSDKFVYHVYNNLVEFRESDSFEDDICLICISC